MSPYVNSAVSPTHIFLYATRFVPSSSQPFELLVSLLSDAPALCHEIIHRRTASDRGEGGEGGEGGAHHREGGGGRREGQLLLLAVGCAPKAPRLTHPLNPSPSSFPLTCPEPLQGRPSNTPADFPP